ANLLVVFRVARVIGEALLPMAGRPRTETIHRQFAKHREEAPLEGRLAPDKGAQSIRARRRSLSWIKILEHADAHLVEDEFRISRRQCLDTVDRRPHRD